MAIPLPWTPKLKEVEPTQQLTLILNPLSWRYSNIYPWQERHMAKHTCRWSVLFLSWLISFCNIPFAVLIDMQLLLLWWWNPWAHCCRKSTFGYVFDSCRFKSLFHLWNPTVFLTQFQWTRQAHGETSVK